MSLVTATADNTAYNTLSVVALTGASVLFIVFKVVIFAVRVASALAVRCGWQAGAARCLFRDQLHEQHADVHGYFPAVVTTQYSSLQCMRHHHPACFCWAVSICRLRGTVQVMHSTVELGAACWTCSHSGFFGIASQTCSLHLCKAVYVSVQDQHV